MNSNFNTAIYYRRDTQLGWVLQTRYYYLKDHLGSVRVTLIDNGTAAGADVFYPFGLQMPGRNWNQGNEFDDQKFTGHFLEQDGNLGIYHAGARMYDPEVPRFYGVDAMRSKYPGLSSYVYAANNPVIFIDPDGNDYELYYNEEEGTVEVIAHFYAIPEDYDAAGDAVSYWNDLEGIYTDDGYEVNFNLQVHKVDSIEQAFESMEAHIAGNVFQIVPDGSLGAIDGKNIPGGIANGNIISVTSEFAHHEIVGPHEVGHALGMTHKGGGIMSSSIETASRSFGSSSLNEMIHAPQEGRINFTRNRRGNRVPMGQGVIRVKR